MSFKDLEGQLALWSKRLQQYNFEIFHRKERTHRNTDDGLSFKAKCKYCSRVEIQDAQNVLRKEEIMGHLILEGLI